jgi:XTP/dITP diphosphohydrolase
LSEIPLLVATSNRNKLREIRAALKGLPIRLLSLDDLPGVPGVRETGRTFRDNARLKSLGYGKHFPGLTLAEDSGLEVDALDGDPGVRSARFSAPRADDIRNNRKLLRLLEGIPPGRRGARFVCETALSFSGEIVSEIRGEVRGRIADAPRGARGFGYDPVFFYPRLKKTFGELTLEEKVAVSHRGRALRKLRRFFERHIAVTE